MVQISTLLSCLLPALLSSSSSLQLTSAAALPSRTTSSAASLKARASEFESFISWSESIPIDDAHYAAYLACQKYPNVYIAKGGSWTETYALDSDTSVTVTFANKNVDGDGWYIDKAFCASVASTVIDNTRCTHDEEADSFVCGGIWHRAEGYATVDTNRSSYP